MKKMFLLFCVLVWAGMPVVGMEKEKFLFDGIEKRDKKGIPKELEEILKNDDVEKFCERMNLIGLDDVEECCVSPVALEDGASDTIGIGIDDVEKFRSKCICATVLEDGASDTNGKITNCENGVFETRGKLSDEKSFGSRIYWDNTKLVEKIVKRVIDFNSKKIFSFLFFELPKREWIQEFIDFDQSEYGSIKKWRGYDEISTKLKSEMDFRIYCNLMRAGVRAVARCVEAEDFDRLSLFKGSALDVFNGWQLSDDAPSLVCAVRKSKYEKTSRLEMVKMLIDLGAKVDSACGGCNFSALYYAAIDNFEDVVDFLVKRGGANLLNAQKNTFSKTILGAVCLLGKMNAVGIEKLLKSGANPNLKDMFGGLPIHDAIFSSERSFEEKIEIVNLLYRVSDWTNEIKENILSDLKKKIEDILEEEKKGHTGRTITFPSGNFSISEKEELLKQFEEARKVHLKKMKEEYVLLVKFVEGLSVKGGKN